jgi:hypothetical protein
MADIRFSDDERGLSKEPYLLAQASSPSAAASPTSSAPYQQPLPTPPQIISRTFRQLQIDVLLTPPEFGLPGDAGATRTGATNMCDLVFNKTKGGSALLKEIAAFPDGAIDVYGAPLSRETRAILPKVKNITVSLLAKDPNADEVGDFDPVGRSTKYTVKVRVSPDAPPNPGERLTFFPPIIGLKRSEYILFGHQKAASRMAVTLFHELVHIWYVYKYSFYNLQNNINTGHGPYESPATTFYDVVSVGENNTLPFLSKLSPFYNEIDSLEGAKPPAIPTPRVPWPQP